MNAKTKKRFVCLFLYFGHDLQFVSRSADWLAGGEYTYHCRRCGHVYKARPYQGG